MVLAILFSIISLLISFVILYFTGCLNYNPYNWFWLVPLAIGVSTIVITLVWGTILLSALRFKNQKNTRKVRNFYLISFRLFARFLLFLCLTRVKKKNYYLLPKENGVYLFNHTSFVDSWYVLDAIPSKFAMVSVEEMSKVPLLGNGTKGWGCIFINKSDSNTFGEMQEIAEDYLLNQNASVAISPEGVVNKDGELSQFKNGAFKLAMKTKKPIILLKFSNTGRLANNKSMFKPKTINSEVLKVITYEEYKNMSLKQLATYCQEIYSK
jgi:1-acyl-sn-glycerol-3-phosphate acyltransferase